MSRKSRRDGRTKPRARTSTPSASDPTSRRPSASGPAVRSTDAARMPTNADAHRTTVVRAAMSARRSAGMRAARDIDNLGVGRPARAMVSGTQPSKPAPAPDGCASASGRACIRPRYPPAMPKLSPKLILEGTRLTHKTDLAFAINEHPAIVGPRNYRYHSPVISAEWCGFTPEPWGRAPITFAPARGRGEGDRRVRRLAAPLRAPAVLLLDHRPIPPLRPGVAAPPCRPRRRLRLARGAPAPLDFHVVLCTRRDAFNAAREERLIVSGNPLQYDDLDEFRRSRTSASPRGRVRAAVRSRLTAATSRPQRADRRLAGGDRRPLAARGCPGELACAARCCRRGTLEQHRDRAPEGVACRLLEPRRVVVGPRRRPRGRCLGAARRAAGQRHRIGKALREVGCHLGERRGPPCPPLAFVARRGGPAGVGDRGRGRAGQAEQRRHDRCRVRRVEPGRRERLEQQLERALLVGAQHRPRERDLDDPRVAEVAPEDPFGPFADPRAPVVRPPTGAARRGPGRTSGRAARAGRRRTCTGPSACSPARRRPRGATRSRRLPHRPGRSRHRRSRRR